MATIDELTLLLDAPWELAPEVAVRPERFGALLYDFRTRRLSFLKDRVLLDIVQRLDAAPSARAACELAGVPRDGLAPYESALQRLAETAMIRRRP
jgi:mycofactocin biosynthesis protein MftB